ncbi:hypothetical protein MJO00_19490, partial [Salmonella enterica subsp. enterica serovar Cerro]|nr:hypothetical protein [Salmonella enterica subsp. enterica serovar Cerro]
VFRATGALAALARPSHIVNYAAEGVLACRLPVTRNPLGEGFLSALGVVAAGVGGHAIASALNQRKRHKQQLAQAEQQPDNEDKQA